MTTYLDASVILRRVLGQPDPIDWDGLAATASSALTRVECLRTVERLRLAGAFDEDAQVRVLTVVYEVFQSSLVIEVGSPVLERAAMPFPVALKTLDAVHLATAMMLRESGTGPIRMATHDRALARASRAMGFDVLGAA